MRTIIEQTEQIGIELTAIQRAIEQMGNKVKEMKLLFELIDQTSLIMWIKNDTLEMLWCSKMYEEIYLKPRGLCRSKDYYNKSDYSTWPEDLAKKFRMHDRETIDKSEEIEYREKVLINGEKVEKIFKKCPVQVGQFYGIVGWQID